jgi:choline dehydrogenase-like flavoprotein
MSSFVSLGLKYDADMFTTGETPHGCGHAPRTHWRGIRSTSADYLTQNSHGQDIQILTHATVDKIILERDGTTGFRAVGVRLLTSDGKARCLMASQEVIISGGTYCSPPMLLRSGIGAQSDLDKLNIPCQVDLPGVGQNLMDHPV